MTIGIHAHAAFKKERTGVEVYVFRLIRYFAMLEEAKKHRFLLYAPFADSAVRNELPLPENFEIRILRSPILWTQVRLALEMALAKPDVLFIPAHVLPLIHPKNSVVTIHDLAYEYFPEMYPLFHQRYLRWTTKYAISKAKKIIVPSESTKKDLVNLYHASGEKIRVIHMGFEPQKPKAGERPLPEKYILYIGRLERKKNIEGLIKAFELAKSKYSIPHKLVLLGGRGCLFKKIKEAIEVSPAKQDIISTGYLADEKRNLFLKFADLFVFPSFYEGFGFPILEAQAAGVPVIASNASCLPEIAGNGALFFAPEDAEELVGLIYKVLSQQNIREALIANGLENIKRFSWKKCAEETLRTLIED